MCIRDRWVLLTCPSHERRCGSAWRAVWSLRGEAGRGAAWRGRAAKKREKKRKKRKMIRLARRFPVPRHGVGMGSGCGTDQSVVARTARGWCEVALKKDKFQITRFLRFASQITRRFSDHPASASFCLADHPTRRNVVSRLPNTAKCRFQVTQHGEMSFPGYPTRRNVECRFQVTRQTKFLFSRSPGSGMRRVI